MVVIKAFHSRDVRAVEYSDCSGRYDIICKAISAGNRCNIVNENKEQSRK